MANPTSLDAKVPLNALLEADTAADRSITLEGNRAYSLVHEGLTVAGAAAADTIIFQANLTGAVEDTLAAKANKTILKNNAAKSIGPGVDTLHFRVITGGTTKPVFTLLPDISTFGNR